MFTQPVWAEVGHAVPVAFRIPKSRYRLHRGKPTDLVVMHDRSDLFAQYCVKSKSGLFSLELICKFAIVDRAINTWIEFENLTRRLALI